MELQTFLNLDEQAQKNYILKLDNNEFTEFIQNVKKKNLRLSMTLSSFRQSNKNINKKDEENKLQSSSKVELYKIKDNPEQPRKIFTEVQVNEKMESIKSRGLITPITVLKKEDAFILIAGQLRLEAFKRLNQEEKNNNIDLESIYLFEDEMNEHIKEASQLKIDIYKKLKIGNQPQIGGYNFNAMNKVFFKRVSIV